MSDDETSTDRSTASGAAAAPSSGGQVDLIPSLAMAAGMVAVPAVVVGVILLALIPGPWWLGLILGLVVAAVVVFMAVHNADRRLLAGLGGGLLRADGHSRLENLVQGLSLAGGVEEPDLVVLADDARNAMAIRNRGRNTLVVTQGLLQNLEVVELEGVVAELLTRLRNGDAESATLGAALFGKPMLDGPLKPVLAPLARSGLGRLLRDDRDLLADREAVQLTRYPPGLLSALQKMRGGAAPAADTDGLAHLWLVDPTPAERASVDGSRPSLDLRIDVLAEF